MLAVDEHRSTLAFTFERIKGGSPSTRKGGGRRGKGRAAAKDVGGEGAAVRMRGGAHLHMHPMACPRRGGEGHLRRGMGHLRRGMGKRWIQLLFTTTTTIFT